MRFWICIAILAYGSFLRAQHYAPDKKLGAENALKIEREMGIYRHDSLNYLVNSVGQKLVKRLKGNPFEFRFAIVDSPAPNAFALPGGYIYVSRGILPLIQTEDELAGILAHEIIHVTERHSVKQLRKSSFTGILKIPGNLVNAVTKTKIGNIINAPINLAAAGYNAGYSRSHEKEADKFGVQLAASAGYHAVALADALERLSLAVEVLTGEAEKRNYFSSHPHTPSRVSAIRSLAGNYKPINPSPVLPSQAAFIRQFDGLCFGNNPQQGVFADSMFIHPDLRFTLLLPPSWKMKNNPSVVAAVQEKGEGIVALQVLNSDQSPQQIGKETEAQAGKAEGIIVLHAGDTTIHGNSGYMLRMKSTSGKENAYLDILWLKHHHTLFQLTGMAAPSQRQAAYASVSSFAPAGEQVLQQIMRYELSVVNANAGETIESLSQRTDNRLKIDVLSVFNDIPLETKLPARKPVKIVLVKPYLSR